MPAFWVYFNAALAGLTPVRFSAGVLLLGFLLWTEADQSQDILVAAAGSWDVWHWTKFALSTLTWVWASWWFARYLSSFDLRIPGPSEPPAAMLLTNKVADWSPRLAGAGVCLVIAYAMGAAASRSHAIAVVSNDQVLEHYVFRLRVAEWVAVAGAVATLALTWKRRWIESQMTRSSAPTSVPHGLTRSQQNRRNMILAVSAGSATVLFAAVVFDPVFVGNQLNSANVYGIGFASILAGLSMLASFTDPLRLPLLRVLLIWSLGIGLFTHDNHTIRTIYKQPGMGQVTLAAALDTWSAYQAVNGPRTLVLLATAGGGIRAAYWTGVVLARLNDKLPELHKQLFAMSAVSGGAIGSALYAAMQADCASRRMGQCAARDLFEGNEKILKLDLLAPPLLTLLFPDMMQNFLPLPTNDRAVSLEKALEKSYQSAIGSDRLALGFSSLRHVGGWQPFLILNSTSVQTGERVVTSSLSLAGWSPAVDLLAEHPDIDFALSTAANNSARFPVVEPPGRLAKTPPPGWIGKQPPSDQVVDGGIYENFGATTLIDLLRGIMATSKGAIPRIAVIQISSDPDLPDTFRTPGKSTAAITEFPDVLGPLKALLASRSARGVDAAALLQEIVVDYLQDNGCYVHFKMMRSEKSAAPPLGWVLSLRALDDINLFWRDGANGTQFSALHNFLGGGKCAA